MKDVVIECEEDRLNDAADLLAMAGLADSRESLKRLTLQDKLWVNGEPADDWNQVLACYDIVQVGGNCVRIIK